jgi:DNA-binding protein Fis
MSSDANRLNGPAAVIGTGPFPLERQDQETPSARPLPGAAEPVGALPRTLNGKIKRLGRMTSEAQVLARDLTSHLRDYERDLVRAALEASRGDRPRPPNAAVNVLPRSLSRHISRLEMVADEVKALVKDLVENLNRRVEAYQLRLAASPGKHPAKGLKAQLEEYERELVLSALRACDMNQLLASRRLGIPPTTLNEKMKRLGLRESGRRRHGRTLDPAAAHSPDNPEPHHTW